MRELLNPAVDRSQWTHALDEPDKVQWVDGQTGLDCLAVRHSSGHHWCGYVGVPLEHPAFGKEYDAVDADVHGGLTFSGKCQEGEYGFGICHIPEEGRPHEVWWLGFDCAHLGDCAPRPDLYGFKGCMDTYKSLRYVKDQCSELAAQLLNWNPAGTE